MVQRSYVTVGCLGKGRLCVAPSSRRGEVEELPGHVLLAEGGHLARLEGTPKVRVPLPRTIIRTPKLCVYFCIYIYRERERE